jgi:hypothetical protein
MCDSHHQAVHFRILSCKLWDCISDRHLVNIRKITWCMFVCVCVCVCKIVLTLMEQNGPCWCFPAGRKHFTVGKKDVSRTSIDNWAIFGSGTCLGMVHLYSYNWKLDLVGLVWHLFLPPSLGTVHECSTSAAVTISRIGDFIGSTIRMSVSSSRNVLDCKSSRCTIYESNSSFVKSEHSQLQYHWCPTAFSAITGLWISSTRYSNRRGGIAMNSKVIAVATVQTVSSICPSRMNRLVCLFWMMYEVWWQAEDSLLRWASELASRPLPLASPYVLFIHVLLCSLLIIWDCTLVAVQPERALTQLVMGCQLSKMGAWVPWVSKAKLVMAAWLLIWGISDLLHSISYFF